MGHSLIDLASSQALTSFREAGNSSSIDTASDIPYRMSLTHCEAPTESTGGRSNTAMDFIKRNYAHVAGALMVHLYYNGLSLLALQKLIPLLALLALHELLMRTRLGNGYGAIAGAALVFICGSVVVYALLWYINMGAKSEAGCCPQECCLQEGLGVSGAYAVGEDVS